MWTNKRLTSHAACQIAGRPWDAVLGVPVRLRVLMTGRHLAEDVQPCKSTSSPRRTFTKPMNTRGWRVGTSHFIHQIIDPPVRPRLCWGVLEGWERCNHICLLLTCIP